MCEKQKMTFQIFLGKNIHVLRNFLLYVFRILLSNDPQQISFNAAKKNDLENGTDTRLLAKKKA